MSKNQRPGDLAVIFSIVPLGLNRVGHREGENFYATTD